jgi:uncharacterized tellurite resistance protein B-like protein
MIKKITKMFKGKKNNENYDWLREVNAQKRLEIATCALFIEMANADEKFLKVEKEKVIQIMKKLFDLDDEYVEELIELSERQVEESLSVFEFTSEINANSTDEEKYEIVKNLWRLILVDDELHPFEDYLIRKISNNLNFSHKDMIAAKMEVKEEMKNANK